MSVTHEPQSGQRLASYVTPCVALLAAGLGMAVLIEWAADSLQIARVQTSFVPMAPATALCFVLLGVVLFGRQVRHTLRVARVAMPLFAGFVLIFNTVLLLQFAWELPLDIEQWIAPEQAVSQAFVIGRMSPVTSLTFVLLSLSTLLSSDSAHTSPSLRLAGQCLAAVAGIIGAVLIIGYWYGAPLLYGGKLIPVALPTAIGVILLSHGLLFDGPEALLFRLATSDSVFAQFTRTTIPGSAAIILIGDWFTLRVLANADPAYHVLFNTSIVLLTAGLVAFLMSIVARRVQGTVHQAEGALRKSEEKYRSLVTNIPDVVWTTDSKGQTSFVSSNVETVLGFTPEEIYQKHAALWFANIHPEDVERVRHAFEALFEEKLPFRIEYRVRKRDGTWLWIHNRALAAYTKDGTWIADGVFADISKRKRAEQALVDNLHFIRTLLDAIPSPIFYKDTDGKYLGCNKAFEEFTERTNHQIVGKTVHDVFPPELADEYQRRDQELFDNPGVQVYEFAISRADGTKRDVVFYKSTFTDSSGAVAGLVGVVLDITDRRRAEEEREHYLNQLLHAQKMESIATLTGGIAHDFNNMLTVIHGYAEMLLLDKAEDDPQHADLEKIIQTARTGADLVRRLLKFSKDSEISPQALNLNQQIEEAVKLMKRTFPKTVEIQTALMPGLGMINADAGQMEQVLMNLCINAKDAMPTGGKLRIETREVSLGEDRSKSHPGIKPGAYVLLSVSDTGIGLDKDTISRIFDPFFTTKGWDFRKGTGLGLSVTKGIVEQHGGWITCHSEPGRGTTFEVYFPAMRESVIPTVPD